MVGLLETQQTCEQHRVAFTAVQGVPEHAQLAIIEFPGFICFYGFIDAKILMVLLQYLNCFPVTMIKKIK